MPNIKPVSDLRNYTEVLRDIAVGEPVFLTKNGVGAIVVMSMEAYEARRYDSEVYDKLKESELQARETAVRRSHEEVMAKARSRIRAIAERNGGGV